MKRILVTGTLFLLTAVVFPAVAAAEPPAVPAAAPQQAAQAVNKPHLIVSSYQLEPMTVEPGASFTLTVDVLNTSRKRVDNLLVSISAISPAGGGSAGGDNGGAPAQAAAGGNTFVTRTTGNSRYVGALGAGATSKVTFELAAAPKADPGLYVAQIDFNYTSEGADFSSNQSVGVSVSRTANFEFQGVSAPDKVIVGESFPVTFEAVNAGGFTVQNVSLRLKSDDLEIEDGLNIIGSLESGDSDSLEARAKAKKTGPVKADLIIKYRNDFNRDSTLTQTVDITVDPKPKTVSRPPAKQGSGGFFSAIGNFLKALFGLG